MFVTLSRHSLILSEGTLVESCKAIDMGDGVFLVISGLLKAHLVKHFISLLSDNAKEEKIPVKGDYVTEEGFAENLFQKYL